MMLAKVESGVKKNSNCSDKRLLHDIEAISQALYLNKSPSKGGSVSAWDNSLSKSAGKGCYPDKKLKSRTVKEDKKPSIWNWKPLKALAHNRSRRFNCCFSLEVNAIEGLSLNFDNTRICVHWKRRDESSQTRPKIRFVVTYCLRSLRNQMDHWNLCRLRNSFLLRTSSAMINRLYVTILNQYRNSFLLRTSSAMIKRIGDNGSLESLPA